MSQPLPLPPVVRIEPASACNLRCTHCPTGVVPMPRSVMKPELFDRVLEQIAGHIPPIRVAVLYHGGEPFLNKRFLEMAGRVKELGIPRVKTVTNGMLVRRDMCEDIVTSGLDEIEFSLDAESPEENGAVRVNCRFEHVVDVVHHLAAVNQQHGRKLTIRLATTQFQRPENYVPGRPAPIPEYLARAFASLSGEIEIKSTWAMQWPSLAPSQRYDLLQGDPPHTPVTRCSLIDETLTIRADGSVVPCCFDLTSLAVMGNLQRQSLAEIWNGPAYEQFRRRFAAADYPELCRGCIVVTGDKFLLRKNSSEPQQIVPIRSLHDAA